MLPIAHLVHRFPLVGPLHLSMRVDTAALIHVGFVTPDREAAMLAGIETRLRHRGYGLRQVTAPATMLPAIAAMTAYLAGETPAVAAPHDLLLSTPGLAALQRRFTAIPRGQTRTYGGLVGRNHAQAVGQACARNPLPIVIPCHRLIAAGPDADAYLGGAVIKRALLDLDATPI